MLPLSLFYQWATEQLNESPKVPQASLWQSWDEPKGPGFRVHDLHCKPRGSLLTLDGYRRRVCRVPPNPDPSFLKIAPLHRESQHSHACPHDLISKVTADWTRTGHLTQRQPIQRLVSVLYVSLQGKNISAFTCYLVITQGN